MRSEFISVATITLKVSYCSPMVSRRHDTEATVATFHTPQRGVVVGLVEAKDVVAEEAVGMEIAVAEVAMAGHLQCARMLQSVVDPEQAATNLT